VIIYIIDANYPRQNTAPYRDTSDVKAIKAGRGESFSFIFSRAFALVYEPVELLRIAAHMNSGVIGLAGQRLELTDAHWFSILRDTWKKGGKGIELHGCGVASDTDILKTEKPVVCRAGTTSNGGPGRSFLQAVADEAGTQVTGAVHCQQSDKWYKWEGATVTCKPKRAYPWKGGFDDLRG
jgi:hypothetical protein